MDFSTFEALTEDDAFALCSTDELVAMGLVSDSDLNELFAPWDNDTEAAQAA